MPPDRAPRFGPSPHGTQGSLSGGRDGVAAGRPVRPAWWLSGGPARCNEPPVTGPLRNGVEWLWR